MRCLAVARRLERFSAGELPPLDREELRLHLQGCPRCRGTFSEWRKLERGLRSLSGVDVPPDFAARVMVRVASEARVRTAARSAAVRQAAPRAPLAIPAAAAAVLALLALLAGILPEASLGSKSLVERQASDALLVGRNLASVIGLSSEQTAHAGLEILTVSPRFLQSLPLAARAALIAAFLGATSLLFGSLRFYRRGAMA